MQDDYSNQVVKRYLSDVNTNVHQKIKKFKKKKRS